MILDVKNLSCSYTADKTVLRDVTFSAQSGQIIAVLGPNGSGKTTLLRSLMGFLKYTGKVTLDDMNIREIPERELWRSVSYVPQASRSFSTATVEDAILMGRMGKIGLFSSPREADMTLVHSIMDRLGISHLRDKKCHKISGGELQMTLIARALASEPSLLILDEPESNLDFKNQLTVLHTLTSLKEEGITSIFNTHYPEHALAHADYALMLSKDGGYRFGESSEVVTENSIREVFGVRAKITSITLDGREHKSILPIELE